MRPFLFLGIRTDDRAADAEVEAFRRCAGLEPHDVRRVRLDAEPLGPVDLDELSGIVLGGGPWNVSDPEAAKDEAQRRSEARLADLARQVLAADFPFLGACYGIGTLGSLAGGVVDRAHPEPIGPVHVELTEAGREDALTGALPSAFEAFVGHKEAVSRLPEGTVRLASSVGCPVQAFRLRSRVYATQFHPELDVPGIVERIEIYSDHGYYAVGEQERVIAAARAASVTEPPRLLARFVELHAR